ncbi:hypothetical Protein YC6258_02141 [Gynuella sunshinyii YC6258]|uniref:Uncharacterized protein n=1 Tax=Gynuella sunshinyii YC6258 TaxID=1445510 RepID=A0A0C5VLG6_9GAMM|nr:hypothetical Protein YC6258_02141 [Gynuella sunshinyii YC6258]
MIHMVRFANGHADLKMRYVQTCKLQLERQSRRALFGAYRNSFTDSPAVSGEDANAANTGDVAPWKTIRIERIRTSL